MENSQNNLTKKNNLTLPILALLFDFIPVALIYLSNIFYEILSGITSYILLVILICPIISIVLGVIALKQGKQIIGLLGKVIAIIAIALPIMLVGFIIVLFMGVATGMIPLM